MNSVCSNKTILITGGAGSLGTKLVNALLIHDKPKNIIVYSRDEGKHVKFAALDDVECVVGDVRDLERLRFVFKQHKPDIVIHTAALKRLNDLEHCPSECVKTNIVGTDNVCQACLESNVEKCILISTDKACHPANVYGASKFIAERTVSNSDYCSTKTIFSSIRYGNVIASRGSFLPIWIDLINADSRILVTDMDMTRFLFSLSEAADAVLTALDRSQGGEVFIPILPSYTLRSIIVELERFYDKQINYKMVGLRPGEKMHEDMIATMELEQDIYYADTNLLAILPQFTSREYTYTQRYTGGSLSSDRCIADFNIKLLQRGLHDANV